MSSDLAHDPAALAAMAGYDRWLFERGGDVVRQWRDGGQPGLSLPGGPGSP